MSEFNKNMEEIFDVIPAPESNVPAVVKPKTDVVVSEITANLDKDLDVDYDDARRNYQEIINKGMDAIDTILEIARNSEHPRAFEVAATMIKNVSDTNGQLIELQKKMRDMTGKGAPKESKTTIDKAIFVGSTAELNKLIKGKKE